MNQFENVHNIGKGSYGTVHKGTKISNGVTYAIKILNTQHMRKKYDIASIVDELKILSYHNSKYLLKCHEVFFQHHKIHLVTDHAQFSDLQRYIEKYRTRKSPIPEKIVWTVFIKCCYGLQYLHSHDIIHRDLKPANILLHKDNAVWIADFGISKIIRQKGNAKTMIGTPYYISPEMFGNQSYGKKIDIWALGCILYELVTLHVPFEAKDMHDLKRKIMLGRFDLQRKGRIYSQDVINMVHLLLVKDCNVRPSIDNIIESSLFQKKAKQYCLLDNSLFHQSFYRKVNMKHQIPINQYGWNQLVEDIEENRTPYPQLAEDDEIPVKAAELPVKAKLPVNPTEIPMRAKLPVNPAEIPMRARLPVNPAEIPMRARLPVKASELPVRVAKQLPPVHENRPIHREHRDIQMRPLSPVEEDFLLPKKPVRKPLPPVKPRPLDLPPLRKQFDLIKKAEEYLPPVVRPPHPRNIRRSRKYSYPEHHRNRSFYDQLPVLF